MPPAPKAGSASSDANNTKFLYAMIKQLGTKGVDFAKIAEELNISNAHAARMRWTRFRQQMEGPNSQPSSAPSTPSKPKGGEVRKKEKKAKKDEALEDSELDDSPKDQDFVRMEEGDEMLTG